LAENPYLIRRKNLREKKKKSQYKQPAPAPTPALNTVEAKNTLEEPTTTAYTGAAFIDVPDDEALYSKMYYPISDVANMFHVNISLIRF